jgi:histidyl-tRNA synthetase
MAGQNEYEKWVVLVKDLFAQTSEEVAVEKVVEYLSTLRGKYGITL